MRSLLKISSIVSIWVMATIFLLFGSIALFSRISNTKELNSLLTSSSNNIFESPDYAVSVPSRILSAVKASDARPVLVENFLQENGSPMTGYGKTFIAAADKYDLDWRLLPAIAFQESTLGKNTIFGSFNAFGWGVLDNSTVGMSFVSWDEAIFTVAKGLREDYYNSGLTTPETINPRYAGDKNWNVKVKHAMDELSN